MSQPINRRQALARIGGGIAGALFFALPAHASGSPAVIVGFGVRIRRPGQSPSVITKSDRFPGTLPADPPAGLNISHKVFIQSSQGWGLSSIRVDARHRRVGTSSWIYYGGQTTASNGYATFNPFYLPSAEYDIEYYVTRNNTRYANTVRIRT